MLLLLPLAASSTLVPSVPAPLDLPAGAPQESVEPGSPRRGYSVFDPVPKEELRDLSADRPDTTESAITVDAGHVQLEISIGDWSRERRDDAVALFQSNVKLGLDDKTDIQVVFDTWVLEDSAAGDDDEGFGDVQIRLKRNLWGNDGETDDAFALFPYVK
ncbi:MAG: transporter, partial [Planctomycetota bacterium]